MTEESLPSLRAGDEADVFSVDPDDLPDDLRFEPVTYVKQRWNSITDARQRGFIAHLAASGSVTAASESIGAPAHALYALRRRPGAESFAGAWDRAVEMGARRVADLLMEYAIYGVPETFSKDGRVVLQRNRPNVRAMQLIAANRFPENFGGINPVDCPDTAVPHSIRRLREKWRAEWEAERHAEMLEHHGRANRQETDLDDRLRTIRTGFQRKISHDPVKRAAWDLLTGPGTDWTAVRKEDAYRNPQKHMWHMHHPDMIVPLAAGAGNIDWRAQEGGDLSNPNPPPADHIPWAEGGREDEIWFERYEEHLVDGEAGESDLLGGRIARGDMRAVASRLRDRAEAWQAARRPVYQPPHGFLADKRLSGGGTGRERDATRRRIERTIAELEREWNAAYSEESWAAWQAGKAAAVDPDLDAQADANLPQAGGEA